MQAVKERPMKSQSSSQAEVYKDGASVIQA